MTGPADVSTSSPRAVTYDGTLRKATLRTTPSEQRTRTGSRPDGTSTANSVTPSGSTTTSRSCTAHVATAIVPCPHAVE
jgi:hypothetical protein